jgi:hypothetical protein
LEDLTAPDLHRLPASGGYRGLLAIFAGSLGVIEAKGNSSNISSL